MKSLRNCLSATEIAKCISLSLSLCLTVHLSLSLWAQLKSLVGSCGSATQGCRVDLLPAAIECQKLFRHNCCHFANLPLTGRDRDIDIEGDGDTQESKQKRILRHISISKQTNGNQTGQAMRSIFYSTFADCSSCSSGGLGCCLFLWLWQWHQWRPY